MSEAINMVFLLIIVANFALLVSSRIIGCINILAIEGFIISALPIMNHFSLSSISFSVLIFAVKALLFPFMLRRALRTVNAKREIEPIVGYSASIVVGLVVLLFSFWLAWRMRIFCPDLSVFGVSASIFTVCTGLFVIIARIKAITQVVGYVVFENGIYLLGTSLMLEQDILIELGVILDLLVFVLLSGIVVFRINREFDHIDTDSMSEDDSVREAKGI